MVQSEESSKALCCLKQASHKRINMGWLKSCGVLAAVKRAGKGSRMMAVKADGGGGDGGMNVYWT